MNVHYGETHACPECKKMFRRSDNLDKHRKVYHGRKLKLTCDDIRDCSGDEDISDGSGNELSDNCISVDGQTEDPKPDNSQLKKVKCDLCLKSFSSKFNLGVHKVKQKQSCEVCNQHFCSVKSLTFHMKFKHGSKKFKCVDCGKEFNSKYNLKRHNETKYLSTCSQCGSVLCNSYDSKIHFYKCKDNMKK